MVISLAATVILPTNVLSAPRALLLPSLPAFAPRIVSDLEIFTFPEYVPAATWIVSPALAALMAAWIVV